MTTLIFYQQPVYKQLALGWKIAKQLSGFNFQGLYHFRNVNKDLFKYC